MSQEQKSASASNVISLPKGGGAIAGMGETFAPDLFTGTGNFSVPIAVPPGRHGLQPSLTLGYSTGSGNGPFGLGWNLSLPGVMRKTNLGIPRYDDTVDVFVLSGAEDLIPVERGHGVEEGVMHTWMRYQPRTEGLFARIIHHTWSDGRDYWEVRTKDGMVTWYGNPEAVGAANTVLYDPENPRHIAQWSICRTVDPFGSDVLYEYEREVAFTPYAFAQLYLKRIKYADYTYESVLRYLCSVELEYATRQDPHSEYRQGFEIRTTRRCTVVRTYTHPLDMNMPAGHTPSGSNDNTVLVKSYRLTYRDELGHTAHNLVSQLAKVQVTGHDGEATESLPPVEFEYQDFDITKRNLVPIKGDHLPAFNLNHPDMDLVDLDGNGLPDFVQLSAGQPIRYWTNRGGGEFERPRTMRNAPTGLALGSEAVQLMDADGDGRVDLVMNGPNFAGYYSLNHDGEWDTDSYRPYATRPPVNLQSAQAQFIDLSGDGRTDVLINAERFICYFQNSPLLDTNRNFDGLQFENRAIGWSEARFVNKTQGVSPGDDPGPNVNFGDPRIRTADMSGDGLADIVQVQDGNIVYWPNLGYGRFGKRRQMRNSPRIGHGFNPAQLILGDADGDGQTDVIYVERNSITVWFNQSGNAFSEPVTISGTPSYTNRDSVRMVDLFGTGTPGLLWTYELGASNAPLGARHMYLDLTGGIKPYVMVGMRNNLGARTRVQYGSSVAHYLRDTYRTPMRDEAYDPLGEFVGFAGKWKTTLPFPVQVVDRVEVIDEISKGKLTTRYFYHHGYWDGGEREFRGFGRVDQFDTETFDRYNADGLVLESDPLGSPIPLGVTAEHYAPPVLAKNWFHLGPVGAERGDWRELDLSDEYFPEFAPLSSGEGSGVRSNMLARPAAMSVMIAGLPRRARRDAFRTLRGTALRSELYAMDGSPLQQRPYTVSETQTGLRLVASPNTNATIKALAVQTHSNHIFFSYGLASRSTTWERGNDPMTKFSFTGEIDDYGQPLSQVSIAVPRGKDPRTGQELALHNGVYDPERGYDATIQYTHHIYKDVAEQYMVDRVKQARSYEAGNDGNMSVFALRDIMLGSAPAEWTGLGPDVDRHKAHVLAVGYTYYDGDPYFGLEYGELGAYGMPVRVLTLAVQPAELTAAYGSTHPPPFSEGAPPVWTGHPLGYQSEQGALIGGLNGGYQWREGDSGDEVFVEGYYALQMTTYDFQVWAAPHKGLAIAKLDTYFCETYIGYDPYQLLPSWVQDAYYMATYASYDYRLLQCDSVYDPNENVTAFAFTPLGLMYKTARMGKSGGTEGDLLEDGPLEPNVTVPAPNGLRAGTLLEYDLFAFMDRGEPVWVKTTQREHHINADYLEMMLPDDPHATQVAVEYSDGFGRQLQTRTQGEDVVFLEAGATHPGALGSSRLPADQTATNVAAVGEAREPHHPMVVVVSGAKLYNNKGKVVEQWEPYFSLDFALTDPAYQVGQRARIYYDALGRPQRTINPDGTAQLVIYGEPLALQLTSLRPTAAEARPSPWTRYTYDAADLSSLTHPEDGTVPEEHRWTPKSEVIDALGRTVLTTEHNAHFDGSTYESVVMQYAYDIKGQLLSVTDPLAREIFTHMYDTAGRNLRTWHQDSGVKTVVVDALGRPMFADDDKGARAYTSYDKLGRPTGVWARNKTGDTVTRRQILIYGDQAPLLDAAQRNLLGRLYQHYDEAGKVEVDAYDFKGNLLGKTRWVIQDAWLASGGTFKADWETYTEGDYLNLDLFYPTTSYYDALDRVRQIEYPYVNDGIGSRPMGKPRYNRAGTLEGFKIDSNPIIDHIAYNARGQRIMLMRPNGFHTRYAYDPVTFRLQRIRTERFSQSGYTYTPLSGNVRQDTAYEYDLGGNITKIKERVTDCGINGSFLGSDALDKSYEYDPLKRLLQATGRESGNKWNGDHWTPINSGTASPNANNVRAYTRNYSYDKVGNVQELVHQATSNNFTRVYNYVSGLDHLANISPASGPPTPNASFLYDAVGNLVQTDTQRFYQWDAADQLVYTKVQPSGGPVEIQAAYLYDAGGQRVKRYVRGALGGTFDATVYIDGIYEHRYQDSAHLTTIMVKAGRSQLASLRIGDPLDGSTPPLTYELEDHLGTIVARLDQYGAFYDREEFYPFGEHCLRQFTMKRYGYVGKEYDVETGLLYYGARYYAAWTCRFISVDPLVHDYPYLTPYNYAGNKPIGDLDIDGMQGTGDPPKKKDPRVFDDGTNRKVGPRTLSDPDYEIHNLPTNPKDGQVATFGYSRGKGAAQVDYVFNGASGNWERTVRDRALNVVEHGEFSIPGLQTGSASDTLCESGAASQADGKDAGAKGKASVQKVAPTTAQGREQLAPSGSTSAPAKPRDVPAGGMATPSSSDVKPSASSAAEEPPDKLWPTIGFGAAAIESAAEDAQKAKPKYRSSDPAESPKATAKANRFLGFVENLMKGIGLVVDFKDLVEAGQKIWEGLKTKGQLLMGEVANLIWTGLGMVLQMLNPIVDMLFAFGDWIASVTGLKDKAIKWINEHWHPQMLSP